MTTSIPQEQTNAPATATVQGALTAKTARAAKRRAHVAPSKAKGARKATRAKKPTTARGGSKTAKILALLTRPGGATLKELRKATGWQLYPDLVAHSADGQIERVKYQVLDSMLLNEVQRQQAEIGAQKDKIRRLEQKIKEQNESFQERLAKLEAVLASMSGVARASSVQ